MEGVRGIAAVGARVGQRSEHAEELERRARPAVGHDQRQGVVLGRADVQEVDRLAVDLGGELGHRVQPRLLGAPVEVAGPVAGQVAQVAERYAAAPSDPRRLLRRPARSGQAVAEVLDLGRRDVDAERADGGGGGHACTVRRNAEHFVPRCARPRDASSASSRLLQTRTDWTGPQLAERLRVTTRTVRKDVERLRALGYPVHAEPGVAGGYRLGAGTSLPPLLLEDDEAVAVAVGMRMAAGGALAGAEEASVRALAKLEQVLPSRLRHRVGRPPRRHALHPRRRGGGGPRGPDHDRGHGPRPRAAALRLRDPRGRDGPADRRAPAPRPHAGTLVPRRVRPRP